MDKYIACTTKKQWEDVLKKFEEDGYKWLAGNSVMSGLEYFNSYKKDSVLHVHTESKKLGYGYKAFFIGETFISAHDFLKGEKTKPIVISRNGRVVTAEDKNTGEKGVATCSPSDEFDFKIGAKIALARLWGEEVPKSLLNDDEKQTFKIGDRVVVRERDDMQKEYGLDGDGDIMGSDGGCFSRPMKHLLGRTATVIGSERDGHLSVTFDDKSGDTSWYFKNWMFKPFVKTDIMTKFKEGDLVTLKEGLNIGEAYGGIHLLNGMYEQGYHKPMRVIEVDEYYAGRGGNYKCVSADCKSESVYYWYSKEMIEKYEDDEIHEGDIVRITDTGKQYTTYNEWIKSNITDVDLICKFDYNRDASIDSEYVVVKIAEHGMHNKTLAYVKEKADLWPRCYLIDVKGLEKVTK